MTVTKELRDERLHQVIDMLYGLARGDAARSFYMGHVWARDHGCGTTMCVAGHMACSPVFQAQGLTHVSDTGGEDATFDLRLDGESIIYQKIGTRLLGLTWIESLFLFHADITSYGLTGLGLAIKRAKILLAGKFDEMRYHSADQYMNEEAEL